LKDKEITERIEAIEKKELGEVVQKPMQEDVEQVYPRAELMANAQVIFGVMPEVLAGSLYGNNAQELTILEVKKAINEFLRRRVS
jgi:hypothetical protein